MLLPGAILNVADDKQEAISPLSTEVRIRLTFVLGPVTFFSDKRRMLVALCWKPARCCIPGIGYAILTGKQKRQIPLQWTASEYLYESHCGALSIYEKIVLVTCIPPCEKKFDLFLRSCSYPCLRPYYTGTCPHP